ncbi:hypothetical protein BO78DRAFT_417130 [Aspergillus sclerotiicarbonarius CBS 121057]|uniref:GRF-like zinc ribbon domain-containing protein n=1 Tax=Aspergillus sclerotiicarbonarius (strain CBS 121057 / IBT 28362) TaxID=1448318 RepID=A0A319FJS3_ASPSB|nr:hypothetical protein BO78DRAFT_417130 [Aspergillus sclerotiicarbonarius CBS 121057]
MTIATDNTDPTAQKSRRNRKSRRSQKPPRCRRCRQRTTKSYVGPMNPVGNAGRPYYKCEPCGTFACFGDKRGIHASNLPCDCPGSKASRVHLTGPGRINTGALFYKCARGRCGFWEWKCNAYGDQEYYLGDILAPEEMAKLGF